MPLLNPCSPFLLNSITIFHRVPKTSKSNAQSDKVSPWHSDSGDLKIRTLIMGHSLIRSLIRSHRSLVRLLRIARFARALRCALWFHRSPIIFLLMKKMWCTLPTMGWWDSLFFMSHFRGSPITVRERHLPLTRAEQLTLSSLLWFSRVNRVMSEMKKKILSTKILL